jgi:hypothetical protein
MFIAVFSFAASYAHATFIDFRGRSTSLNVASAGGIAVTLTRNVTGTFVSTATRFGIDASSPNDVPDLVDGGSGTAERLTLQFQVDVYVASIVISEFGASDAGTFTIKGASPAILANGVNDLALEFAARSSAHIVAWTGANSSGDDRGFSVDGIHVQPAVPFNADFDGDAQIDGNDLLAWQRGIGKAPATNPGNANGDNVIDHLDLQVWSTQFGQPASAGIVVPEPVDLAWSACILLLVGRLVQRPLSHRLPET